jgi:gliding motility-associated-like protein
MKKLLTLFVSLASMIPSVSKAQLTTDNTKTATDLVLMLVGGSNAGIQVSNITYTGDPLSKGTFNGFTSNLGLDSGIVLSSGFTSSADGPNNGNTSGVTTGGPDADISQISGQPNTFNASILEFDFVPLGDTLRFNYIFASDEYAEWVGTAFNDAFGFFLSGPGIAGPFSSPPGFPGGSVNVAVVPGTGTPVAIGNINCQGSSPYYVCNDPLNALCYTGTAPPLSYTCPGSAAATTVGYDGVTTVLTAVYPVQRCSTYHIKLAVSDCADPILDSGVFLEANSFAVNPIKFNAATAEEDSLTGTGINVIEGCGPVKVSFCYSEELTKPDTMKFYLAGDAINGVDYTLDPPNSGGFFAVPAGEKCVEFFVYSTPDGILEPTEKIEVIIEQSECFAQLNDTIFISLINVEPMTLIPSNDTGVCIGAYMELGISATGGYGTYYYAWNYRLGTDSVEEIRIDSTINYVIMVGDSCGNAVGDTILIEAYEFPDVSLSLAGAGCLDSAGVMTFNGETYENSIFHWDFGDAVVLEGGGKGPYTLIWSTPGEKTVSAYATFGGCSSDTIDYTFDLPTCPSIDVISNIFTPNGDGTNDYFYIPNLERFPGSLLSVYNRWGKKVYENENYANNWDGKNVSDGVYYYILKIAETKTTELDVREGFVTITR